MNALTSPASPRALSRRSWLQRAGVASTGLFLGAPAARAATPAVARPPLIRRTADGLVRLSSNENPYGPAPSARAAMSAAYDEACRYPYAGASDDLVRLIAEREGVTPDHVLLACGSSEILTMAAMAYGLGHGEIVAADPTYQKLLTYAENLGAHAHRVPLDDGMVHDLDAMERRVTQATRLVFVCNPNNPTGTIVDPDRLRDFCASVAPRAVVFMDEAYIELLDEPERHTMVDLVRRGENVIVSRTFSKIFGMAGLRLGYAIARPDIVERLAQYGMGGPNVLALRGAIASLHDEAFQAESRQRTAEGRAFLYRLFDEVGYAYTPASGNFVFFHTGVPILEFQQALRERGVLVARPFPPYLDWCRVSVGTPDEMAAFADALRLQVAMG